MVRVKHIRFGIKNLVGFNYTSLCVTDIISIERLILLPERFEEEVGEEFEINNHPIEIFNGC